MIAEAVAKDHPNRLALMTIGALLLPLAFKEVAHPHGMRLDRDEMRPDDVFSDPLDNGIEMNVLG